MATRRARRAAVLAAVSVTAAAPVATGWTTASAGATSATPHRPAAAAQPVPAADDCPTTPTGQAAGALDTRRPSAGPSASAAYYGNPKVGVQVASDAPGLCPSFTDSSGDTVADLGDFVIGATDDGPVASDAPLAGGTAGGSAARSDAPATPNCTTEPATGPVSDVATDVDGDCQMDPSGDESFPMQSPDDVFTFDLETLPLGWVQDPDDAPTFQADVSACGDTAGTDSCATSPPYLVQQFDSSDDVFDAIGIFRVVDVTVTSQVTGRPMAGVTVDLACTVPAGEPADVCAAPDASAVTDAEGVAAFAGLYAPGAPLTVSESGLPAPYKSVSASATVPSPVTAATTTGAEIDAATKVPVTLAVSPTAPLATVHKTTPEDRALDVTSLGSATPGLGTLTVTGVGRPRHGEAVLAADGTVTYTPDTGYVGPDSFSYTADPPGAGGTGTVDVTVQEVPPTAEDTAISTTTGTPVSVDLLPLTGAAAGNTRRIAATGAADHGSVKLVGPTATYTPVAGFDGSDRFTYTVVDDHGGTATATVRVTVAATTPASSTTTVPVTTTTAPVTTTTTAPVTTTTVGAAPTTPSTLPFTGVDAEQVGADGFALILAGGLLTAGARHRRRHRPRHRRR